MKRVSTIIWIQHCPVCLTLVISIGRPDLETVIIWSSPLACLRCCVAPVMSWNTSQRRSHQSQRKLEKQAEATIEIQTCLGSYQELRGNTDPELTFICLERNAARIKACLLSNKKSSCCWAARVIVKEVLTLILCLVLYVHIGNMLFMHQMHQTPAFIIFLTVGLNKDWNSTSYTPLDPSFTGEVSLGAWEAGDLDFWTVGVTAGWQQGSRQIQQTHIQIFIV